MQSDNNVIFVCEFDEADLNHTFYKPSHPKGLIGLVKVTLLDTREASVFGNRLMSTIGPTKLNKTDICSSVAFVVTFVTYNTISNGPNTN